VYRVIDAFITAPIFFSKNDVISDPPPAKLILPGHLELNSILFGLTKFKSSLLITFIK